MPPDRPEPLPFGDMGPTERAKALSPVLNELADSSSRNGYDYAMLHAMCVLGIELYLVEHKQTKQRRVVNQADYQIMVNGLSRDAAIKAVTPKDEPLPVALVDGISATKADAGQWRSVKQVHDGAR